MTRFDETWFRLLEWTAGQTPSERLAALVLDAEGFAEIDPSHPLGGKDGGKDALLQRDGHPWVMAVYFPRGQQPFEKIAAKLTSDITSARAAVEGLVGVAFVTNQELRLGERKALRELDSNVAIELYHLERLTTILDRPRMAPVRQQFLDISPGPIPLLVKAEILGSAYGFDRTDEVLDRLLDHEEEHMRERNERLGADSTSSRMSYYAAIGVPELPKALSEEDLAKRIEQRRARIANDWGACQDYLAASVWQSVGFKITNLQESFLTNVQIIFTLQAARGLENADIGDFMPERFKDPAWEPDFGPYGISPITVPILTPAGYPVTWEHNETGDLEITITLPELRPHPPWRHSEDDVVIVVKDDTATLIDVTYTVTAHGYGTTFIGEPFQLVAKRVDMSVAVSEAFNAYRDRT